MYICNYNAIVDNVVSELALANTSTSAYPLSANLTKAVKVVQRLDLGIHPEFKTNYPVVNVRLVDRREYPEEITGSNFNRGIFLDMKIEAVYDDFSGADTNLKTLLSNIEANLRYNKNIWNYTVSGFTTTYIVAKETRFKTKFKGGSDSFNLSGELKVELKGKLKSI